MQSYRLHLKMLIRHGGVFPGKKLIFITFVDPNSAPPKYLDASRFGLLTYAMKRAQGWKRSCALVLAGSQHFGGAAGFRPRVQSAYSINSFITIVINDRLTIA